MVFSGEELVDLLGRYGVFEGFCYDIEVFMVFSEGFCRRIYRRDLLVFCRRYIL